MALRGRTGCQEAGAIPRLCLSEWHLGDTERREDAAGIGGEAAVTPLRQLGLGPSVIL